MTTIPSEAQTGIYYAEMWLDELGPMSQRVRALVKRLVVDGDWALDRQDSWMLRLACYGRDPRPVITIWRTNGRFVGAKLEHVTIKAETRRLDDLESWVS